MSTRCFYFERINKFAVNAIDRKYSFASFGKCHLTFSAGSVGMQLSLVMRAAVAALLSLSISDAYAADKVIGVSFPHADQPIVAKILSFAKKKADSMGYTIVIDDPGDDMTKQVGNLDTWIGGHTVNDIVAVVPNSPEVFNDIAKRARGAGIPWITYAASIPEESTFLSWDHKAGGYLVGEAAAKWINARPGSAAKVAILGFEQGEWSRQRRAGLEEALKKLAPGAEIVARQDALQPSEGASVTDSILQAHPDLNVVLAVVPGGGEGAYQAFLNAGKAKDDPSIFIGDVDGSARSLSMIQAGSIYRAAAALDLQGIGEAIPTIASELTGDKKMDGVLIPYVMITAANGGDAQRFIDQWK
jgi:ribose transport system substrate-binding protein